MTIISKFARCVDSFLHVNVLTGKFFNFSLDGILHEMLIFLLLFIAIISIVILSDCLLTRHTRWSLHSYSRSLSLLLSLILLVVLLLNSRCPTAICQVIMHDLTPLSLSLHATTRCLTLIKALGVFLFLETYILKWTILSIVVLLSICVTK